MDLSPESRLGWRAKIGVITPTVNTVTEPEFNRLMPDGVTVHFTRMPIHFHPEEDGFKSLFDDLDYRLAELRECGVDLVAYNCTVGSMACPADVLSDRLEQSSGVPAVYTTGAVLDALQKFGVRNISLATPYTNDVNAHEKAFLEANGIEVKAMAGMDFSGDANPGQRFSEVSAGAIFEHALSVDRPETEAIFISCANFGSAAIVEKLEEKTGKPVITSNTATLWASLRRAGVAEPILGGGRLLREY